MGGLKSETVTEPGLVPIRTTIAPIAAGLGSDYGKFVIFVTSYFFVVSAANLLKFRVKKVIIKFRSNQDQPGRRL